MSNEADRKIASDTGLVGNLWAEAVLHLTDWYEAKVSCNQFNIEQAEEKLMATLKQISRAMLSAHVLEMVNASRLADSKKARPASGE